MRASLPFGELGKFAPAVRGKDGGGGFVDSTEGPDTCDGPTSANVCREVYACLTPITIHFIIYRRASVNLC